MQGEFQEWFGISHLSQARAMLSKEEFIAILLRDRLPITAFLATVTRNHHLAEDVFQDICVKAVGREEGFESREHLLNWVYRTGRNRAIDLLRSRDNKYQGLSEHILDALSGALRQHDSRRVWEMQEALKHCLEQLTPNNREILRLKHAEGLQGADVARVLGRKLETVYQALTRIYRTLGECVRQRMVLSEAQT
jgi:RNA polymerase sigma-70 factor (ECF subfamily)